MNILSSQKKLKFLMVFTTTYLCECGFSSLIYLKNKCRNELNVEPDLRLKLTQMKPDIKKLCFDKQEQLSHQNCTCLFMHQQGYYEFMFL